MILTELIREQILGVTVMFGAGIGVAVLYQVFRSICRLLIKQTYICSAMELAFWIVAAYGTSKFLYYCAYGQLSVHTIGAFVAGVLLWKICFYDIINNICAFLEMKWNSKKEHGKEETKQSI